MQVLIREIVIHDAPDPWKKRRALHESTQSADQPHLIVLALRLVAALVLLVLFGAVVLAVALDVPVQP